MDIRWAHMEFKFFNVNLIEWIEKTIRKMGISIDSNLWNSNWYESYFECGGQNSESGKKVCPKKAAYTLFYLGRIKGTNRPFLNWDYTQIKTKLSKNGVYAIMAINILKNESSLNITELFKEIQREYRKYFDDEPANSNQGGPTLAFKLFKANKLILNP